MDIIMASNNGEGEEITAIWWENCKFSLTPGPSPKGLVEKVLVFSCANF